MPPGDSLHKEYRRRGRVRGGVERIGSGAVFGEVVELVDIGIAGGKGEGLLIKKGEIIRKVPEDELLAALKHELDNWNR